jgi:hypothetical protein
MIAAGDVRASLSLTQLTQRTAGRGWKLPVPRRPGEDGVFRVAGGGPPAGEAEPRRRAGAGGRASDSEAAALPLAAGLQVSGREVTQADLKSTTSTTGHVTCLKYQELLLGSNHLHVSVRIDYMIDNLIAS